MTVTRPSVLHLDEVGDGVIDSNGNGALDSWLNQSDAGNNAYQMNVTRQPLITDGAMNGYRAILSAIQSELGKERKQQRKFIFLIT